MEDRGDGVQLTAVDWSIIAILLSVTLVIGIWSARSASKDVAAFFLGGRHMPWWLLGMSMVATTFSTDTPNLVTDIVRTSGVAGNWTWWCFLLSGMLTTFIYAKLWRRLGVTTDIEFYERRYSGPAAIFLRGFRAVYLGVFFNVMIMGSVTLAAIKIVSVLFPVSPVVIVIVASLVTVVFSTAGGLIGVLITDLILFIVAMIGAVLAAYYALEHPDVGGLQQLAEHPVIAGKIGILPDFSEPAQYIPLFLVPLAVQWWAVWYPGSEPGGGGYVAQRMLAAKNERHAVAAVGFFNFAHYALRPWPWIIVALASLIVFPDLASLQRALPHVDPAIVKNDLAYPAMLTLLPPGALGLVLASLVAAYISTISTHLNWGASYVVNDVYKRFVAPHAGPREQVLIGRISTVLLMVLAGVLALMLENAFQAFRLLLTVGAGTGLLFLLRWFWLRINAWSEISAMIFSFLIAVGMEFLAPASLGDWQKFVLAVALTTVAWVAVTLLTAPTDAAQLRHFQRALAENPTFDPAAVTAGLKREILASICFSLTIYSTLFGLGAVLFGAAASALVWGITAALSAGAGWLAWRQSRPREATV